MEDTPKFEPAGETAHFEQLPNGQVRLVITPIRFKLISAELSVDQTAMEQPGMLHHSVTPGQRKIAVARWSLSQLRRCMQNEAAALMYLELFVSELRSSTLCIQKSFAGNTDFTDWYSGQQKSMRADELLRWLGDVRNEAQHPGIVLPTWSQKRIYRLDRGKRWGIINVFLLELEIKGKRRTVTLEKLEEALARVEGVVKEAHEKFWKPGKERQIGILMEFLRETSTGAWEHFDPYKGTKDYP